MIMSSYSRDTSGRGSLRMLPLDLAAMQPPGCELLYSAKRARCEDFDSLRSVVASDGDHDKK
jgi:hypothetical protein